jgi:tetratricopeptide (TPR) repeat protein
MRACLAGETYEDVYYLPPPTWLRVFSLGHEEALADLVWMRALIYYGDELANRGEVAHVFDYGEAIVTLDPLFAAAYRWAGLGALYRASAPTARDAERAAAFMIRGLQHFPEDPELLWEVGATLTYELPPLLTTPEAKVDARQRGLPYLQAAARLGGGPPWLALTNVTQLSRLGRTEQAIRHLEEMFATVRDDDTREQLAFALARLRSEAYAQAFAATQRDFEERWRRDAPYLSPTMYLMVSPRAETDTRARWLQRGFIETAAEGALDDAEGVMDASPVGIPAER